MCVLVLTLTLTHHLFPLADFSATFPHKLTGAIVFLALLHPLSRDSIRHKTGKENHAQPNRAVAPRTTRCPSVTNYSFPLIHSLLPCHEQNDKAFHQHQPHPSLKSRLMSSRSWQTTASCWVQESVPALPPASPPRDTVAGCAGKEVPIPSQTQPGPCRSSDCSRSRG